jgi:hypothetical protein
MKKYKVVLDASVIYEIIVEANSEEEAKELGHAKLRDGEGSEIEGAFSWGDGDWGDATEIGEEND